MTATLSHHSPIRFQLADAGDAVDEFLRLTSPVHLGAAVARRQSRIALTELLARCPDFEVDASGIVWAGGSYVRRPLSVPFRVAA
jgi:hypothetical protein